MSTTEPQSVTPAEEEADAIDTVEISELQEPPIGEQASSKPGPKPGQTTGRRSTTGVWVVYGHTEDGLVVGNLYHEELPALRDVASSGGGLQHVFVPWGESLTDHISAPAKTAAKPRSSKK